METYKRKEGYNSLNNNSEYNIKNGPSIKKDSDENETEFEREIGEIEEYETNLEDTDYEETNDQYNINNRGLLDFNDLSTILF